MPHTALMGPKPRFSAFGNLFPSWDRHSHNPLFLGQCCSAADWWLREHKVSFPRFFFRSSILCLCGFYPVAFLWWVWKRWTACTNKIEAYSRNFQRSPFLLLPWILMSCVLGMVAEMYLFWAAGGPELGDAHLAVLNKNRGVHSIHPPILHKNILIAYTYDWVEFFYKWNAFS